MHKMTRATTITPKVKRAVYDRDGGCCIICGRKGSPNAHYIARSHGGLGIEENIVTLCQTCHMDYDNGGKRKEYGTVIRDYLKAHYPGWDETALVYDRWRHEVTKEPDG